MIIENVRARDVNHEVVKGLCHTFGILGSRYSDLL